MRYKLIFVIILSALFTTVTSALSASETDALPLTLELSEGNGDYRDYIEIIVDNYEIHGDYIGFKLNVEEAKKDNVDMKWNQFTFLFYDDLGNTYDVVTPTSITTNNPYLLPGYTENSEKVEITWGNSFVWPEVDFFGTLYIPWARTNSGTEENPTAAPAKLVKIRIQLDTRSSMRNKIVANLFSFVDVDLIEPEKEEAWIGDVHLLESFDSVTKADYIHEYGTIIDFTTLDLESVERSANAKLVVRKMAQDKYNALLSTIDGDNTDNFWKIQYSRSGQKFSYGSFDNGIYDKGLHWTFGNFYEDYDKTQSLYGTLNIDPDFTEWQDALGITFWVKNESGRAVSFDIGFDELNRRGYERWNLNTSKLKRLFAYNVLTNEEYGFGAETDLYIPADFEGWIRIPFSEFDCPAWSLNMGFSDGILNLNNPHTNLYIASDFGSNETLGFKIDNFGLYYRDFEVGKLFDRNLPSIAVNLAAVYE